MPSSPLRSTNGRAASGVASQHRLWPAHTAERRRAWHANIAFGQHIRSNDVGRGMSSSPLGSTHDRITSGVACHHGLWAAHAVEGRRAWHAVIAFGLADTVRRHRVWHAIISLGRHTVERRRAWYAIIAFGQHRKSNDVGRGMPSSPLGSTYGRMASGVACHHRSWKTYTITLRRAWHAIITFGLHKRSNTDGRGMKSLPLDCTDGQTTSGVA